MTLLSALRKLSAADERVRRGGPVMKKMVVVALVVWLGALGACSPGDDEESGGGGRDRVVVGLTVSRTGSLTAESTDQFNGLELWAAQVNERGGLRVGDDNLRVDLVNYDDESAKTRVQQLYTRLVNQDRADFLVSPYSSGLTEAAAVVAEQNEKVMLAAGAASDSIFRQGFDHVFQVYTPSSRYLTGSVELLRQRFPEAKRLAIVHEEETFSTDVAEATREYVENETDLDVVVFDGYPTGTTDFGPFISRISAAHPDALLGGGHFQDGSTLVRQIDAQRLPLDLISILVAPSVPEFSQLGDAAVGVVGPSQWEPEVAFSEDDARDQDLAWFGPSNQDLVAAYQQRHGEAPGYHAMGGYVSGLLLQHAVEEADSVATDEVRRELDQLRAMTFWGELRFSTEPDDHGRQIGHEMVQIQWQRTGDRLEREIVWPLEGRTAEFRPSEG